MSIIISIASLTDAAGYDKNNYAVWTCPDLSRPYADADADPADMGRLLSSYGAIMAIVHCEEAHPSDLSEAAISAIKDAFHIIPSAVTRSESKIRDFLGRAVQSAENVAVNPNDDEDAEHSPISVAIAWAVGTKLYIATKGSISAYLWHPVNGLSTPDEDDAEVAVNEIDIHISCFPIYRGESVFLCSKSVRQIFSDSDIENILSQHPTSSCHPIQTVWDKGAQAGWTEDCAFALMRIIDGPLMPRPKPIVTALPESSTSDESTIAESESSVQPAANDTESANEPEPTSSEIPSKKPWKKIVAGAIVVALIFFGAFLAHILTNGQMDNATPPTEVENLSAKADSTKNIAKEKIKADSTLTDSIKSDKEDKSTVKESKSLNTASSSSILDYYEDEEDDYDSPAEPSTTTLSRGANITIEPGPAEDE